MVDYTDPRNRSGAQVATDHTATSVDQGLRSHMLKVYNHMGVGLALSGATAYLVMLNETLLLKVASLFWVFAIAEIGLVIFLSARIYKMTQAGATFNFYLYAALNGLTLGVILAQYTGDSIAKAFLSTAIMFGAMSIYGHTTKRDLSGFGSFLLMGLIGIIIASIVNFFLASTVLHYAISAIGVLVFVGLTAYDTQRIKDDFYRLGGNAEIVAKSAIIGALHLYLDFINLMIFMLQFLGNRD